jgi:cytochrome c oxidase cbb3-type subunit III
VAGHGEAGKGGIGPGLTGPVRIHGTSVGEIFHAITDGIKGTAMRGFQKGLTEDMRWHPVNYIKSLGKD